MAEPVPTPDADQIELVSEITMLPSATVVSMISAFDQETANAKWKRTVQDLARWPEIRDEVGDIKKAGPIEFFEQANVTSRLSFRNLLRIRYGQTALTEEIVRSTTLQTSCGTSMAVTADW